jgi:hypothetical protein
MDTCSCYSSPETTSAATKARPDIKGRCALNYLNLRGTVSLILRGTLLVDEHSTCLECSVEVSGPPNSLPSYVGMRRCHLL